MGFPFSHTGFFGQHGASGLIEAAVGALAALKPRPEHEASSLPRVSVRNRFCIVTGGNRGIGYETARGLLREGAIVVVGVRGPPPNSSSSFVPVGNACDAARRLAFSSALKLRLARQVASDVCFDRYGRSTSEAGERRAETNCFTHDNDYQQMQQRERASIPVLDFVVRSVLLGSGWGGDYGRGNLMRALLEEELKFALSKTRNKAVGRNISPSDLELQIIRGDVEKRIEVARDLEADVRRSLVERIARRIIVVPLDLADFRSVKRFGKETKKAMVDYVNAEKQVWAQTNFDIGRDDEASTSRGDHSLLPDGTTDLDVENVRLLQEEVQERFHALICNAAAWSPGETPFAVNCLGHHHLINKLSKGEDGHSYSVFGSSLKASHFSVAPAFEPPAQPDEEDQAAAESSQVRPRVVFVTSRLLQFGDLPSNLSRRLGLADREGGETSTQITGRAEEMAFFRDDEQASAVSSKSYMDSKLVNALQARAYAALFSHAVDSLFVCPGWCMSGPSNRGSKRDQASDTSAESFLCPFASQHAATAPPSKSEESEPSSCIKRSDRGVARRWLSVPARMLGLPTKLPRTPAEGAMDVVVAATMEIPAPSPAAPRLVNANQVFSPAAPRLVNANQVFARLVNANQIFATAASASLGNGAYEDNEAVDMRCERAVAKFVSAEYLLPTFFARFLRSMDQIVEARKK
ncbi:unnamed protein product [Amoebophrya sp. A120]|nr:unnamed protein product [Amoebophrya sp. A120]|eukprot:GSA120T00001979001.1